MIEQVLAPMAIGLNIALAWPQAVRAVRTRSLTGVSPATWAISVVLFASWTAYATTIGFWSLAIANASCLAAAVIILTLGVRAGWPARYPLLAAAGTLTGVVLTLAPPVLLVGLIAAGVAQRVPQLAVIIRARTPAELVGVSATTWGIAVATSLAWLVISVSRGDLGVAVANVTAAAITVALLAGLAYRRHVRAPAGEHPR